MKYIMFAYEGLSQIKDLRCPVATYGLIKVEFKWYRRNLIKKCINFKIFVFFFACSLQKILNGVLILNGLFFNKGQKNNFQHLSTCQN